MTEELLKETYMQALEVLRKNMSRYGFTATIEKFDNYYSVWARDSSISTLAALKTGDKELIQTGRTSIDTLLKKIAENGQVPTYIEVENKNVEYGGFGSITSVDSNLWVIIALSQLYKNTKDKNLLKQNYIDKVLLMLKHIFSFDSNDDGMLEIPDAGDWADIMDRRYHVLYDQCLYYQALKEAGDVLSYALDRKTLSESSLKHYSQKRNKILTRKKNVKRKLNLMFWVDSDEKKLELRESYMIFHKLPRENFSYYQSHFIPFRLKWMRRFETFGNILTILSDIADQEKSKKIIKHIIDNEINSPVSVKALYPPVKEGDHDWLDIYSLKEQPYTYHNGGVWPMMVGFWIDALMHKSKKKFAYQELEKLSDALARHDWEFHEYFHGKNGEPMGRKYMTWSAAGYIIAYKSVFSNHRLFS